MKKLISLLIAFAVIIPSVSAEEWITLSKWSYNDVSEFVAADLLPDCLKGVKDFRREISRGAFCELVYSSLEKNGIITNHRSASYYSDCEQYPSVGKISTFVDLSMGEGRKTGGIFNPENVTDRDFMANVLFEILLVVGKYDAYYTDDGKIVDAEFMSRVKDTADITNADKVAWIINDGVMTEDDDGYFKPDDTVTIEQAVVAVNRMVKRIPRVIISDSEYGETLRDIGGGLTEEITDGYYNVIQDDKQLLSLESDVYTKLLGTNHNGKTLVFAVNFNDRTDVFDADTGKIIYTIPYIVNELDEQNGIAYTISGKYMPYYSGMWSMDNKEIYPPEYSRYELNLMVSGETDQFRAADGTLYYSDWNDNGNMYCVDTNGENKKLIVSGHDCTDLTYLNGKIFFNDNLDDMKLYSVNPDGSDLKCISEKSAYFYGIYAECLEPYALNKDEINNDIIHLGFADMEYRTRYVAESSDGAVYNDNSLIYTEYDENAIKREYKYDGNVQLSARNGYIIYRYTEDGKSIRLSDFYMTSQISAMNGDGRIYFMDAQKLWTTGSSPIYVNDNNEVKLISGDYSASCFGFYYNIETRSVDYARLAFITQEEAADGTYHILDLKTGRITQDKLLTEDSPNIYDDTDRLYDENGRYYFKMDEADEVSFFRGNGEEGVFGLYVDYKGEITYLGEANPVEVIGDYAYYTDRSVIHVSTSVSRNKEGAPLRRINYKTGEKETVSEDYARDLYSGNGIIAYQTVLGEVKLIKDSDEPVTIYPCKGLYRYGEVMYILHAPQLLGQKTQYYKLDTEGHFSILTENDSQRGEYIPFDPEAKKIYVRYN